MKRTDPATDLAERAIRQWQRITDRTARSGERNRSNTIIGSRRRRYFNLHSGIRRRISRCDYMPDMQHCRSFSVGSRTAPPTPDLRNYS